MTRAAALYADDEGGEPAEIECLALINRFGAMAVFGRPLYRREMLRMIHAENVVRAVTLIRKIGPAELEKQSPYLFRLAHKALKTKCQTM